MKFDKKLDHFFFHLCLTHTNLETIYRQMNLINTNLSSRWTKIQREITKLQQMLSTTEKTLKHMQTNLLKKRLKLQKQN